METTEKFLQNHFKTAFEELREDFLIEFRLIRGKVKKLLFCTYEEIENMLPEVFQLNKEGWDPYFGVNPRSLTKKKKEKDIEYGICLFVDIDIGEGKHFSSRIDAREKINSFPLKPSCVVSSGSGIHGYWYLAKPIRIQSPEDRKKIKKIISGLIKTHHADKSGKSIESVMRLPGTINHKYGKRCEVVERNYEEPNQKLSPK